MDEWYWRLYGKHFVQIVNIEKTHIQYYGIPRIQAIQVGEIAG